MLSTTGAEFGTGNLICHLDELVEPRVVCDSSPLLVPAMPDPCCLDMSGGVSHKSWWARPAKAWWYFC